MKDFFVSYNGRDKAWAEWIAWTLEEDDRYSVLIQAWDFRPGENFVLEMHQAAQETRATVIVLSQNYLNAEYTHAEWAAAFVHDPTGQKRKLIPFRVAECHPGGILKALIYADLVGLSEEEARTVVLEALKPRLKPDTRPAFPGDLSDSILSGSALGEPDLGDIDLSDSGRARGSKPRRFPGQASSAVAVWREKIDFLRLQEPVIVDAGQKFALMKQIEEAERKIRELGG